MNIVADENVDQQIVHLLRANGHEVLFVAELDPGINDEAALILSRQSKAIRLTADKDFGELVFRQRLLHSGVLLIRLSGLETDARAELVAMTFVNPDHHRQLRERAQVFGLHVQVKAILVHAKIPVVRLRRSDLAVEFLKTRLSLRTRWAKAGRPPHAPPRSHSLWRHPPAVASRHRGKGNSQKNGLAVKAQPLNRA